MSRRDDLIEWFQDLSAPQAEVDRGVELLLGYLQEEREASRAENERLEEYWRDCDEELKTFRNDLERMTAGGAS